MRNSNVILLLYFISLLACSIVTIRSPASEDVCETALTKNASSAPEELLVQCLHAVLQNKGAVGAVINEGHSDLAAIASVTNYVDHWAYLINSALRTGDTAYTEKNSAKLNRLDKDLQKFPVYRGVVFRGSEFPPNQALDIGIVFTDKAFVSTSLDVDIAKGYVGVPGYLSVIVSNSGRLLSYGKSTQSLSVEKEVLFPRNRMFKIVHTYKSEDHKLTTVFMVEQ
jgi:hypothetical protein